MHLKHVLGSEACAIETYNKLAEKYRTTDLVTHEMFEDLWKTKWTTKNNGKNLAEYGNK